MASRAKSFNVESFIKGVSRPERTVPLCTDTEAKKELNALMDELESMQEVDDEPLSGNPRRDEIINRLKEMNENPSIWTEFVIQAPTRKGRVSSLMTLANVSNMAEATRGPDIDKDNPQAFSEAALTSEADLIADCLVAIDGNRVELSLDQAKRIQSSWPNDLVQELVQAIQELGSDVNSAPFSQRLSDTLSIPTS